MDSQLIASRYSSEYRPESSFLNTEGPQIDRLFGGLTVRLDGSLKLPYHYKRLQPTVQEYICKNGGNIHTTNTSEWKVILDDLNAAEDKASHSDNGTSDIFRSVMLKVGEHAEEIDPWLNLIPDAYGLCVVKASFALLLNRARDFSDHRKSIFDAFLGIRDTIEKASSRGIHFQDDAAVYRQAGDLYESIVLAIEELLAIVESTKKSRWQSKSKKEKERRIPQEIFESFHTNADKLLIAVDNCRDAMIKRTGRDTHQMMGEIGFIRWNVVEMKALMESNLSAHQSWFQEARRREQDLCGKAQERNIANSELYKILREQEQKSNALATRVEELLLLQSAGQNLSTAVLGQPRISKAVVSIEYLFDILCSGPDRQKLHGGSNTYADIANFRNADLNIILSTAQKFDAVSQSQAHSILNQDRFFDWMYQHHPDMLLIDGNIQSAAGHSTSPMSLLCANLGLTLANLEPSAVFATFFCGLHVDAQRDDWYGPAGMIRSLLVQLLLALIDRESLDLEFLDKRSYVRGVESHDIQTLCDMLHKLIRQFDSETTIYCIIDGVSKYDVDLRGSYPMLRLALQSIQSIVRDDNLRPKLKVLMTIPFRASARIKQVVHSDFYLALSPRLLIPRGLSETSVMLSIQRPSTPRISSSGSAEKSDNTDWSTEDYDDE